MDTALTKMLGTEFPVIMAPMFLVSNVAMVKRAIDSGISGAFPALNYRTDTEFRAALEELKTYGGSFGINLIVNKSNIRLKEQLQSCLDMQVGYIITSLGSPREVIDACKPLGIKVFCDVVEEKYAEKVQHLGADAVIAVNNQAGGHAGTIGPQELIRRIRQHVDIPVISAGGVGRGRDMKPLLDAGAAGFSIGTLFIATEESPVSQEYKQACIDYGKEDIVMTTKLSGTPCTVINTAYVKEIGTRQNSLERLLNSSKQLKKWAKAITFVKGMKALRKAAFSATYKTVWCAGPAIEYVNSVKPVQQVVRELIDDYQKHA